GPTGTLLLSGATAVTGGINVDGGSLLSNVTGTLSNALTVDPGFSATFGATAGNTLTLATLGGIKFIGGAGATLPFRSAADTGTVVLGPLSGATVSSGAVAVDGGTFKLGNSQGVFLISNMQDGLTVGSGATPATFDLNGNSTTVWNLAGTSAGTITNSGA